MQVSIYMDDETEARMRALAEKEHRKFSNMVYVACLELLERRQNDGRNDADDNETNS